MQKAIEPGTANWATSLRTKLVCSFIALSLVPVLVLGLVSFERAKTELGNAAASHLQEAAVAYGETVDRSLSERYADVPDFADNPIARGDDAERQVLIDHFMEIHPDYDLMLIADAQGRIISVSSKDAYGHELATADLVGQSVADTEWFEAVVGGQMGMDATHYSDAWHNPLVEAAYGERRLTLPFTSPIVDESGTLVGAWHNEVSFDRMVSDVMSEARHALAEQGFTTIETMVLRADGVVLDSADSSQVGVLNLVDAGQESAQLAVGPAGTSGSSVEANVSTGIEQVTGFSVTDGAHGFDGYKWGILVRQDAAEAGAPARGIRNLLFSIGIVIMIVTALVGLWLARTIVNPIQRNADLLQAVSSGDLTVEFPVTSRDEVGQMSSALNTALHSIRETLVHVDHSTTDLTASANQLTGLSRNMSQTANETSHQASDVAAEAERISVGAASVASAMDQMSSSIREISENTSSAALMTSQAVNVSADTRSRVQRLDASATEIGNVVNVITSIADQTDLLALNATIEAHRVGAAGKGFAVVANEVKALAAQTSGATDQIKASIEAIQHDTVQTVEAISEINDLVEQVNEISTAIAGAVEEQNAASSEVSSQILTVTEGTANISGSITSVAGAASATTEGAEATSDSADHLSELAVQLSDMLHRFTLPIGTSAGFPGTTAPPMTERAATLAETSGPNSYLSAPVGEKSSTPTAARSATDTASGRAIADTARHSPLNDDLLEAGWQ